MDFDFKYLKQIITQTNALREEFTYREIIPEECDITYISTKKKTDTGLLNGLRIKHFCEQNKLTERSSIRSNATAYEKIYRQSGRIVRVDSYISGRIDVIFLTLYKDNVCYFFPFSSDGDFYPTYTYVSRNSDELIEEYAVNKGQIVYELYKRVDSKTYAYKSINYVPNGMQPILAQMCGKYTLSPQLQYRNDDALFWYDDKK